MRICGIDPGLRRTGYGVIETDGRCWAIVDAGTIKSRAEGTLPERLSQIHEDLRNVLDHSDSSLLAVENLYTHYKHPQTAVVMGHVRGVILLAAATRRIDVLELPATLVKKSLTGNGRASKQQVQEGVRLHLGLTSTPEPHDIADALALAIVASQSKQVLQRVSM